MTLEELIALLESWKHDYALCTVILNGEAGEVKSIRAVSGPQHTVEVELGCD